MGGPGLPLCRGQRGTTSRAAAAAAPAHGPGLGGCPCPRHRMDSGRRGRAHVAPGFRGSGVGGGQASVLSRRRPHPGLEVQPHWGSGTPSLWLLSPRRFRVSPQVSAPGDEDEEEDDFVDVPEKEGYEACVPEHLWPRSGEWGGAGVPSGVGSAAPERGWGSAVLRPGGPAVPGGRCGCGRCSHCPWPSAVCPGPAEATPAGSCRYSVC